MAGGATRRQAEPDRGQGLDAVLRVDGLVLLGDRPALAGRGEAAVEAGGDTLLERGPRQEVSGHLLDGELVEGLVAAKCVHHPIAVGPNGAVVVDVDAMGIRVTNGIEPEARRVFSRGVTRQHTVHRTLVGTRRAVGLESGDVRGRRRKPGDVQRDAA